MNLFGLPFEVSIIKLKLFSPLLLGKRVLFFFSCFYGLGFWGVYGPLITRTLSPKPWYRAEELEIRFRVWGSRV